MMQHLKEPYCNDAMEIDITKDVPHTVLTFESRIRTSFSTQAATNVFSGLKARYST